MGYPSFGQINKKKNIVLNFKKKSIHKYYMDENHIRYIFFFFNTNDCIFPPVRARFPAIDGYM